jgi:3',5'-cyclic AMP phosphodiesterase CpdA
MDKLFRIHASQCWKIMSNAKKAGELSETCKTFLKEWYANDKEDIQSKYLDKGNEVESDNIDFAAKVLGYGLADKNTVTMSDEFMVGTCDVDLHDCIIDVKSPWNNKTLLDNIYGIDPNYEWQLRVYMRLYRKEKGILFYGLQNTPETDWYPEISFDHLPEDKRWLAYTVTRDETLENMIVTRVLACREWLNQYHELVTSKLGKCH